MLCKRNQSQKSTHFRLYLYDMSRSRHTKQNSGHPGLGVGFSGGSDGKESASNARPRLDPQVGKIPCRRKPAPAFLPREPRGQRSLAGYSPQRHRVGHNSGTNTFTSTSGLEVGMGSMINGHEGYFVGNGNVLKLDFKKWF